MIDEDLLDQLCTERLQRRGYLVTKNNGAYQPIERIQRRVAETFGIEFADMTSPTRTAQVAFPRQVAMYMAYAYTAHTCVEVGQVFGGRHYSTVMHATRLVLERMERQPDLRKLVEGLRAELVPEDKS